MPEINKEYQDFAKEVVALAVKYKLSEFQLTLRVFSHEGYQSVTAKWEAGRHGEDSDNLHMEAMQHLYLKVDLRNPVACEPASVEPCGCMGA